jgi:hypothetical protein
MAQVFVPVQAASFATITPAATGRASTMFNAVRQLGGAVGVAVLTTVIVLIGPVHLADGHEVANLTAYRVAFLTAAAICVCAIACSLSIRDADAASTIPARRGRAEGEAEPAVAALPASGGLMASGGLYRPARPTGPWRPMMAARWACGPPDKRSADQARR